MKNKLIKKVALLGVVGSLLFGSVGLTNVVSAQETAEDVTLADFGLDTLTEFPIVDEPIEMSMMGPGTGLAEWGEMPTMIEYAEKTNINWTFRTPPMGDFNTNLNLAFASGDLPDVILGAGSAAMTRGMEVDYGSQGIILPLEDLIPEHAPNLHKVLEENPDIKKSITSPDGHIYSLPFINMTYSGLWPTGPLWYNGSWFEALGVEKAPETLDELYDLLVRMRDEDPNGNGEADEIPITDVGFEHSRPYFLQNFGIKSNGIEESNGEVRFAPVTDNYRAYLEFMNKLYTEKILDQEVFSQSNEQKKAKGQNNQIGLFQDWFSYFTLGGTEEEAINNPMFRPVTSEWSPEPIAVVNPRINTGNFVITSNCEHPEAALAWVDYFYSTEGSFFFNKGPEGHLWNFARDDEGNPVILANHENIEQYDSAEDYRGRITPNYGITVPAMETDDLPIIKQDVNDPDETPFTTFLKKETAEKMEPFAQVAFPVVYLTVEEQDTISAMQTDITTYVGEMEAKFITGVEELNDETWQNYIDTLNSMNLEEYVNVYKNAYERWANS